MLRMKNVSQVPNVTKSGLIPKIATIFDWTHGYWKMSFKHYHRNHGYSLLFMCNGSRKDVLNAENIFIVYAC